VLFGDVDPTAPIRWMIGRRYSAGNEVWYLPFLVVWDRRRGGDPSDSSAAGHGGELGCTPPVSVVDRPALAPVLSELAADGGA
jgi:hypothetical protein